MVTHPDADKTVSVLGVTGSIGRNTVEVLKSAETKYNVYAVTAHRSVDELAELAKQVQASVAVIGDPDKFKALHDALAGTDIEARAGEESLMEVAQTRVDWLMCAIVGDAAIKPMMHAMTVTPVIALANKECLVCAGPYLMELAREYDCQILPVDSEHNAIFQLLNVQNKQNKHRIAHVTLTASGGACREIPIDQLPTITAEDALKHPNWDMGSKVTIDSATMMNKGLEVIEAYYLFGLSADQIKVLIHPESIIHGLIQYDDGSTLAQMGYPDMKVPISYALAWPDRMGLTVPLLNLDTIGSLNFEAMNHERYPAFGLAIQALKGGALQTAILNTANEVAVAAFLAGKIGFMDITSVVEKMLAQDYGKEPSSLDDLLVFLNECRRQTGHFL